MLMRAQIRYALCGGVAVTIHGATQSTKDIDMLDFLVERAAFAGLLANTVEVLLPEGPLWVVSRDVLLAMKRLAGRNQNLADLEKLEAGDE